MTGGRSLFSYAIRAVTSGFKYRHSKDHPTHVGIVVEWCGEKFIMEMLSKGITLSPFSRYTGEESKKRWIIGVSRFDIPDHLRQYINYNLVRWFRRRCEKKYDWKGVLSFIGGKGHRKNKWFCSELAAFAWKEWGGVPIPQPPEKISPLQFDPRSNNHLPGLYWVNGAVTQKGEE